MNRRQAAPRFTRYVVTSKRVVFTQRSGREPTEDKEAPRSTSSAVIPAKEHSLCEQATLETSMSAGKESESLFDVYYFYWYDTKASKFRFRPTSVGGRAACCACLRVVLHKSAWGPVAELHALGEAKTSTSQLNGNDLKTISYPPMHSHTGDMFLQHSYAVNVSLTAHLRQKLIYSYVPEQSNCVPRWNTRDRVFQQRHQDQHLSVLDVYISCEYSAQRLCCAVDRSHR